MKKSSIRSFCSFVYYTDGDLKQTSYMHRPDSYVFQHDTVVQSASLASNQASEWMTQVYWWMVHYPKQLVHLCIWRHVLYLNKIKIAIGYLQLHTWADNQNHDFFCDTLICIYPDATMWSTLQLAILRGSSKMFSQHWQWLLNQKRQLQLVHYPTIWVFILWL